MEGVSPTVYKGLRNYWTRRGYQKLNGPARRRPTARAELGRKPAGAKRAWRVRVGPKLKLSRVISAPKKLLVWLRDAYVSMMLRLAGTRAFSVGYGGAYGGACSGAYGGACGSVGFGGGPRALKEYDERMIVEIYKSLVVAQGLVPRGDGSIVSQVLCTKR